MGYLNLNQGPLPYQAVSDGFMTCHVRGRHWMGMPAIDSEPPP